MCALYHLQLSHRPRYTFVSYDGSSVSMIDYVLMPIECIDLVLFCEVADDHYLNVSRHRPTVYCYVLIARSLTESLTAQALM